MMDVREITQGHGLCDGFSLTGSGLRVILIQIGGVADVRALPLVGFENENINQ